MSWGYKLMLTFIVFATMMGYMVYRCFGNNSELVEKEYYKSELRYQHTIDGIGRADSLSTSPVIQQSGGNLQLQLPEEMKNRAVSGSIVFYCAYDATKDRKIILAVDNNGMQQLGNTVRPGIYTVKIDWNIEGKNYYAEKSITIL